MASNKGSPKGGSKSTYQGTKNRKGLVNKNGNNTKKNLDEEEKWILSNPETLTLQSCLIRWNEQEKIIRGINLLYKNIHISKEFITILEGIYNQGKWPINVKNIKFKNYNPLHEWAWIQPECHHNTLDRALNLLKKAAYDIFAKNAHNENALEALEAKFTKGHIMKDEYHFRYKLLANPTIDQIHKIIIAKFNKIDNFKPFMIDHLRYVLLVNYDVVLTKIAEILITRKIPDSLCALNKKKEKNGSKKVYTKDRTIGYYTIAILRTFSGADSNFEGYGLTDKSLELFFELNTNEIPGLNILLKFLWGKCIHCTLTNEREYKELNPENLSIVIGQFAKENVLIDEYDDFMLNCLSKEPKGFFANFEQETRTKMAIRALNQSRKFTASIETAFKNLENPGNFFTAAIVNLFDSRNYDEIDSDSEDNKEKIKNINFFRGIDLDKQEVSITEEMELFDEIQGKNESQDPIYRLTIIEKLLICLIENFNLKLKDDFIEIVLQELIKRVPYHEITCVMKKIEESEYLEELKIDAGTVIINGKLTPISEMVWQKICEFFNG
jgi:hypothetical protein